MRPWMASQSQTLSRDSVPNTNQHDLNAIIVPYLNKLTRRVADYKWLFAESIIKAAPELHNF